MQALCWDTVRWSERDGGDNLPLKRAEKCKDIWRDVKTLNPLADFEVLLNEANVSLRP